MKELLRKKSVKISLLLIILLVVMGIVGINVQSAQKNKEYEAHIAAAEKYLTELDYEQAIVEYTLALEIEPNAEEVLNGLEQTYLAYAQSVAEGGDYDKAISILEQGYAQIGRDSLYQKIEELRIWRDEAQVQLEQEAEFRTYMQEIYELMEAEDYDGTRYYGFNLKDILQDEKYIYLPEDNESLTGIGAGFYRFTNYHQEKAALYSDSLSCYTLYFGNFVDGKREGNGISISNCYIFIGEWKNDRPNGQGEITIFDQDGYVRGNLIDGLWDGMVEDTIWKSDDIFYHAVRGIPEDKTDKYLSLYEETFGPQSVDEQKEYLHDKQAYVYKYNTDEYGTGGLGYQMIVEGDTLGVWEFAAGVY